MKDKSDTLNYKVKILNIALFVPVAQLSANVFNEISTILSRKNEPKAISIHYRRIEIRPISLPKNKEEYYSESLFQDADLPCRIVVCFVETAHKNGTPTSNPFAFQRSWTIPKSEKDSKNYYEERSTSNLERLVDDRFCRLEKQFTSLIASFSQAQPQPIKRKTRGKKTDSLPQSDCSDPCTSQEANDRLRQFIEESENQKKCLLDDSQSDLISDDLSVVGETKQIYIKKVDCQLNSNSLDQVEDKSTEDECMQMYWRMFKFNGQLNSLFSNGITYDDFRNGYYFCVFDLSTSGKSGTNYVVPSIRVGHLRIR
jgi:hypothetical protein